MFDVYKSSILKDETRTTRGFGGRRRLSEIRNVPKKLTVFHERQCQQNTTV